MKRLRKKIRGYSLYNAGLPDFPRNFTRDSILSSILAHNQDMLKDQLEYCAEMQGKKFDSCTAEEPGKIFHESPGIILEGLSTGYAACDTTALFLIGHKAYMSMTDDRSLSIKRRKNIEAAAEYILFHIKNGLFIECPSFCGSNRFALKVTYWKDSQIKGRKGGKPIYPVVYTLAHIQNIRGLESAAEILKSEKYAAMAEKMRGCIDRLYDHKAGTFYIALDKKGPIRGVSSDALHALFYLKPGEISTKQLGDIVRTSMKLETAIGYRTLCPESSRGVEDGYHASTVWPFEQAFINIGARKFGLERIVEVSFRISRHLDTSPEIFVIEKNGFKKGGCDPQLWTIAAKKYFSGESRPPDLF